MGPWAEPEPVNRPRATLWTRNRAFQAKPGRPIDRRGTARPCAGPPATTRRGRASALLSVGLPARPGPASGGQGGRRARRRGCGAAWTGKRVRASALQAAQVPVLRPRARAWPTPQAAARPHAAAAAGARARPARPPAGRPGRGTAAASPTTGKSTGELRPNAGRRARPAASHGRARRAPARWRLPTAADLYVEQDQPAARRPGPRGRRDARRRRWRSHHMAEGPARASPRHTRQATPLRPLRLMIFVEGDACFSELLERAPARALARGGQRRRRRRRRGSPLRGPGLRRITTGTMAVRTRSAMARRGWSREAMSGGVAAAAAPAGRRGASWATIGGRGSTGGLGAALGRGRAAWTRGTMARAAGDRAASAALVLAVDVAAADAPKPGPAPRRTVLCAARPVV